MNADARREAMIAVGPGEVRLTDRRTRHTWTVELAPHLLAAVPVTQAGYAEVMGQLPSAARGDDLPVDRSRGRRRLGTAMHCPRARD